MVTSTEMREASQAFFNDYKEKLASLRESRTDTNLTLEAELKELISTEGSVWEVASKIIDFQEKPIGDQKYIRSLLLSLRDEANKKRSAASSALQSPAPGTTAENSESEASDEVSEEKEPENEASESEHAPQISSEPESESEQAVASHRFSVRPSVSLEETGNSAPENTAEERPRQFVVSAEQTPAESEYTSFTPAAFEDYDDARATPSSFIPTTNLQYSMTSEDLAEKDEE